MDYARRRDLSREDTGAVNCRRNESRLRTAPAVAFVNDLPAKQGSLEICDGFAF